MNRTFMQAFIVGSSLSIITALPFLNTHIGLQKVQDRGLLPEQSDDPTDDFESYLSKANSIGKWIYPTGGLTSLFPTHMSEQDFVDHQDDIEDEGDDDDNDISMETLSKRASMNKFYGVRGKRLSFGYYPFGFLRQYRNGRRRKVFPRMFVASRGKRQDQQDLGTNNGSEEFNTYGSPMSKRRRLGFTALRGR